MTLKLLTEHHLEFLSLKGGCTGSSESTYVKMPHCWKSHVTAHITLFSSARELMNIISYLLQSISRKSTDGKLHHGNSPVVQPGVSEGIKRYLCMLYRIITALIIFLNNNIQFLYDWTVFSFH